MSGVSLWPAANGRYEEDASLMDCGRNNYPRYRKVDGSENYIFSYASVWLVSNKLCLDKYSNVNAFAEQNSLTPDLVSAGSWRLINSARNSSDTDASITVTFCTDKSEYTSG